jgi:hypothetical protein
VADLTLEWHALVGLAAGVVALLGFVPYLHAVVRGRTHPNRATWWIWALVSAVSLASYRSVGSPEAIWVPASYTLGPLVTAIVATKYGTGRWSGLDRVCLAGSLAAVGIWATTGEPVLALAMNIVVDSLGAVPTLRQAWLDPASENLPAWLIFLAGNALNLLALTEWSFATAAYPLYLLVATGAITLFLVRPRGGRPATA